MNVTFKRVYYTVTVWAQIKRCKGLDTQEWGRLVFSIEGVSLAVYPCGGKQTQVLMLYTIKKKKSISTRLMA